MIIYAIDIKAQMTPAEIETVLSKVSSEKREKLERMYFEKDLVRGAVGEGLIRALTEKQLGIPQSEIVFSYNPYGKPVIDNCPEWHFNLSHSGDWVVAAIDDKEIGVDVEKRGTYPRDIAQRFFAEQENQYLSTRHQADFDEGFIRIWTLKESYIKALGQGLSIPLDSFSVVDENLQWMQVLDKWRLESFELDEHHKGALCFQGLATGFAVLKFNVTDFLNGFLVD